MPGRGLAQPTGGSDLSLRTDTTWRYSVFGAERLGRGAVLFTGPDGIRDHHVQVNPEHRYVGEGTMSQEGTSEVAYLWRAPTRMPHPRPKSACVGEVGWGIPTYSDRQPPCSGRQIILGEFRQAVEDRHTHQLLNAWYPAPGERRAATTMADYNAARPYSTKPSTAARTNDTGYVSWHDTRTGRRLSTSTTSTHSSQFSRHSYGSHRQKVT